MFLVSFLPGSHSIRVTSVGAQGSAYRITGQPFSVDRLRGAMRAGNPGRLDPDSVYAPLWLYQGTWIMMRASSSKADTLTNECTRTGKYLECQQTTDGELSGLIVFVPRGTPGHYYVNGVTADGLAFGRMELEIDGDRWTYQSKQNVGTETTYHRTTNVFSGTDRIHFEQFESKDGLNWTSTDRGDEVRQASPTR